MRGLDLDVFAFDHDLTWTAFLFSAEGAVLGRYGSRDPSSADAHNTLDGLAHAMRSALEKSARGANKPEERMGPPVSVDTYPAARRLPARSCVHCHQVYDFRRLDRQARGLWSKEELWVYPQPENIGLSLNVKRGDEVVRVAPGSAAERAGLRAGDVLVDLHGVGVSSIADVCHALQQAPARGKVGMRWKRDGRVHEGELALAEGWRKTDLSWRWSLRGVDPPPWVQGDDLNEAERKDLGLPPGRLAFRQSAFVSAPARLAGIQAGDIIVGVDGKELAMSEQQFTAFVRLNYKAGDRVVYNVLRNGKRIDVPLRLEGRGP